MYIILNQNSIIMVSGQVRTIKKKVINTFVE